MVDMEELETLLDACINGGRGWKYGPLHPEGGFKSIDDVASFLAEQAKKSDGPKALEAWCVHVADGDDSSLIVCVTGNGPTSEAHARFLAAAPYAVHGMATELRTLRARVAELESPAKVDPDLLQMAMRIAAGHADASDAWALLEEVERLRKRVAELEGGDQ